MTPSFMELAMTFAGRIEEKLSAPKTIGSRDSSNGELSVVTGLLELEAHGETGLDKVPVSFSISPEWMSEPPMCWCFAHFIRREVDWHINRDRSLCYVLQARWQHVLRQLEQKKLNAEDIMEYAVGWCVSSVDSLVVRHLIGQRIGIEEWPSAWAEYKHYDEGIQQFYRELNDARFHEIKARD